MIAAIQIKLGLLACLVLGLGADGAALFGKVVSIQDGDAITILVKDTTYRIRLYGIDCPERS